MQPPPSSAAVADSGSTDKEPAGETYSFPLSAQQRGLWFVQQWDPTSAAYNTPLALRLRGEFDEPALARALSEIVRRHEILRTTFALVGDEPMQEVHPARPLRLPCVDLSGLPRGGRDALALRLRREECERPVNLVQGPLLRVTLLRLDARTHDLLLVMHHIVNDGWSEGVLARELSVLYEAFRHGRRSPLAELSIQYADYAVWQRDWLRSEGVAAQLAYWRRKLAGLPELDLPRDRQAPPSVRRRGETLSFALPAGLSQELRNLARREGVTLFVVLLAGFKLLLGRYSGLRDVAVGTIVANRTQKQTEDLIGCFVNNLVLRTDLRGPLTFRQLLKRVETTTLEAYEHQDVPFDKLVEELNPERPAGGLPLIRALFVFHNVPAEDLRLGPLEFEQLTTEYRYSLEDLCVSLHEESQALLGCLSYPTEVFTRASMQRFLGHFERVLAGALAAPDRNVEDVPLLSAGERAQVVHEWSGGAAAVPVPAAAVHALFEERAAQAPDAPAVICAGRQLTYGELNAEANRLAHHLRAHGIGPESGVGILAARSLDSIVAVLGVLKAGAAYVPLDPDQPRERLAYMLADARPALVLTQAPLAQRLPDGVPAWRLDAQRGELFRYPAGNPERRTSAEHLAYVIYTSGSTGRPKGVMVSQRSVANHALASGALFGVTPADRVLQFASLAFDASAEEIFTSLTHGAALVLRSDDALSSPADFLRACGEWRVTVLDLPTAYWHELVAATAGAELAWPACVRLLIIGGEAARAEALRAWSDSVGAAVRLLNTYGPTEATIVATACDLSNGAGRAHQRGSVPIGRPIDNAAVYVVDHALRPVPPNVYGEIVVGGAGVARGYLGRAAATAERFVPDPFARAPGARLYRTGDIGRWLPEGVLEFRGRVDGQVKLRGFRIELGELEAVLGEHPAVEQSAVLVREHPGGDRSLAAFVACRAGRAATPAELREWMHARLPEYMLPATLAVRDALPKTVSGKLDRQALLALAPERLDAGRGIVAPRTPTEETLAAMWREVLGLAQVSVHDNFFESGGHSFSAVKLLARLRQHFGSDLPLSVLFQRPTIAALAEALDSPEPHRDGPLVPLRTQGQAAPLYLIHAGGGGLLAYRELTRALPAGRPLWGFERPGFEDGQVERLDVEQLAALYVEPLRRRQPHGPYALAGWSFGGLLAFEMARQLERAGERVAFVGLIDTPPPLRRAMAHLHALADRLADRLGLEMDDLDRELHAAGGVLDAADVERFRVVMETHLHALRRYRPKSGIAAERVVLFHAFETVDEGRAARYVAAWQALSRGPVARQAVPGDHYTMMERPHVAFLAGALERALGGP